MRTRAFSLGHSHSVVASLSSKDEPRVPRHLQPPPPPPRLHLRLAPPPSGRSRTSISRSLPLVRAFPRRGRSTASWPVPEIAPPVHPGVRRQSLRAGRRSHRGRARWSLLSRLHVRHSHPAKPHPTESEQKISPHTVRVAFHGLLADLQNSNSIEARYFASLVPLVNCLRLVINGLSLATDEGLVKSVTREGNPQELLRGPLYYVLILILCAIVYWRESPTGVISLAMMCGGDGIADIIGRRFGSQKLPYNHRKSWAGSISMFVCGFMISIGMLHYFSSLGYFRLDWTTTLWQVALISLVATVVESLPTKEVLDDNISVPLSSMLMAFWIFGW
ncbi:hypothetical protein BT93_G2101 [Corymbia citriodora subsp. variegata]|nr:hypothetical protein BT93_G2101 [Corymbia citriodora subsp. variegata]